MSGITEVNQIAAASAGADAATTTLIADAFGLMHVLQVYTSAMMAVAVWDWLCCLSAERKLIWKARWSVAKCLYIWTRYYGLLAFALNLWLFNGNFTAEQCKPLHYLIAATCAFVVLGSETILAMRTYAFLGLKRWTAVLLGSMLLGEAAFLIYVSAAAVHQTILPVVTSGPCTASDAPGKHIVTGFWLAPVAFDLICTFLTLWKVTTLEVGGSRLLALFIREGIFYFLSVAAVNVLNAIFMFQSNANIQNINCFLALILTQVLCCRLTLNLRAQATEPQVIINDVHHMTKAARGVGPVFARTRTSAGHADVNDAVSIALDRFEGSDSVSGDRRDSDFGVKVHVTVEHDSDHTLDVEHGQAQ